MGFTIKILITKIKVTTKFNTYESDITKIEGVTDYTYLNRYQFTVKASEKLTLEQVAKNIEEYLNAKLPVASAIQFISYT